MSILNRQTHHELETWRTLLDRALSAIDAVERGSGAPQQIRIGGGTVLSALWGHRYSKDVDLFTRDPQVLGHLRPWLNDDVAAILGTNYEEGSNAIKFRLKAGSIDVVAAADILPDSMRPSKSIEAGTSRSRIRRRSSPRSSFTGATGERFATTSISSKHSIAFRTSPDASRNRYVAR